MLMDNVKCCDCGYKGLAPLGQEICPECGRGDALAWVDEDNQEKEI